MSCGGRCGWGAIIRSSISRSGTTSTRARCRNSRARATGKARWPSQDPEAFQSACLQAISAFEQGLGHDDYDGQIYWWMGLIWEILGERHSACGAFRRAMETDPDNFAELTRGKLRLLEAQPSSLRSAEEIERLSRLGPITDEDQRAAREALDACDSFPSVFLE